VVVTQPAPVIQNVVFRTYPVTVTDSNGQQVQTVLQYRSGILTWLLCCIIFWLTFEFGLCCLAFIPFCINDAKDVYHITPTDNKVVGVYKRL